MRCNPSRWLWGLIPIAMLSWGTYYRERPNVEADLTVRATEALGAAGQAWAKVTLTGRDAVITGRAQKDGEPKAALDIVRGVWGIRTVQLKTDLAGQPAQPERIGPPAPDPAAVAAARAKEEAEAAAARKAAEDAEAARKAKEEADAAAALKAKEEAEAAAAAQKAQEEAEAAAALKAKEDAEAAAAQRAKEQTEAAIRAQAEAEAALKAEEDAAAQKAKEDAEAAAAQKAKDEAEAAAQQKAKEEAEAAARKAEEEAAALKAKEEAEAAAREAEALAAQKAKQEADMAAEAKADAEAKAAAEAEAKKAAEAAKAQRKTTAETEACEKQLAEAVTEDVILFDRASADIDRKSSRTIKKLSEIIKACPGARVEVEGHTDSEGTDERNQNLSERRARAVVDSLVKAGIAEERLSAVGFGAGRPAASNDTKAGMAKNRRIEFRVFTD